MKLSFAGTEFEFEEFQRIHNSFPRLFEPAFRLQQEMMIGYMGENWWNFKKNHLRDMKDLADAKILAMEKKKEKKKQRKKNRKTQRAMGSLRYYLCPCMRKYYDPSLSAYDKLSEEEKALRDQEIAVARRQAELRVKNPETAVWLKYQKKIAKDNQVISLETVEEDHNTDAVKAITAAAHAATAIVVAPVSPEAKYIQPSAGVSKVVIVNSYLDDKLKNTEKVRVDRADGRAARKAMRDRDPDLQQKSRTTISGVEF